METKTVEYELAMSSYRKEQNEIVSVLESMFGKYGEPKKLPKEFRKGLAKKLKGISVSRMIIEARYDAHRVCGKLGSGKEVHP